MNLEKEKNYINIYIKAKKQNVVQKLLCLRYYSKPLQEALTLAGALANPYLT